MTALNGILSLTIQDLPVHLRGYVLEGLGAPGGPIAPGRQLTVEEIR